MEVRERFTATEVADWVAHLPRDGAVNRVLDDSGGRHSDELELLRAILLRLDLQIWQNGEGKGEQPEAIRFPWEDDDSDHERPDAMTTEELTDWLDDDRLREALGLTKG